jgi:predicted kinase
VITPNAKERAQIPRTCRVCERRVCAVERELEVCTWKHVAMPGAPGRSLGRLVVITGLPGSGKTTVATKLAHAMPACRMCPDDWMTAAGIDLWDDTVRARIEAFQLTLSLDLLRAGSNVVIEWGLWAREERDAVRDVAPSIGALVELRYVSAHPDELWRRVTKRDLQGHWGSRSIRREELNQWVEIYQPPTDDELATYDASSAHRRERPAANRSPNSVKHRGRARRR